VINKLQGRIEKRYLCFLPDKEAESLAHPKIVHASCSMHTKRVPYISKFIEREIIKIPQVEIDHAREKGYPCVLIAGPSHYTKQVYEYLKTRFTNIDYPETKDKNIEILEGYKILMYDQTANLGWRIILECSHLRQKADIIKATYESKQRLAEALDDSFRNEHLEIVALLIKVKAGEVITEAETNAIVGKCEQTIDQIKKFLDIDPEDGNLVDEVEDTSVAIKMTTINGSKGMSAEYVFMIGMNNGELPKNAANPTDNEICQLIVGLTRTRKGCYLISNARFGIAFGKPKSVFIDWINPEKIDRITVNANFFRN
jgi:hypothetical protein